MYVLKTIRPDDPGAKKYKKKWGDRLVAVRYRRDKLAKQRRYMTVEIVVESSASTEPQGMLEFIKMSNTVVGVQLAYEEKALRDKLKKHGAYWSKQQRLWFARYDNVESLSLTHRIVFGATEKCLDVDMSLL